MKKIGTFFSYIQHCAETESSLSVCFHSYALYYILHMMNLSLWDGS